MSNALERLSLQAEAVRRALRPGADGGDAGDAGGADASSAARLWSPDGAVAELVDRLADHERLLRDLDGALGDEAAHRVPVALDGSVGDLVAEAQRSADETRALLARVAAVEVAVAERERRALAELRRSDAVGLA